MKTISKEIQNRFSPSSPFFALAQLSDAVLIALHSLEQAVSLTNFSPQFRSAVALRIAKLEYYPEMLKIHENDVPKKGIDLFSVERSKLGKSKKKKERALLSLTTKLYIDHGHYSNLVLQIAQKCGATNREIAEIVLLCASAQFLNELRIVAEAISHNYSFEKPMKQNFKEICGEPLSPIHHPDEARD